MKYTSKVLLVIIILLMNSKVFSQKKDIPTFTAQLDGWHKNNQYPSDSSPYLHVKTSITNNSTDTLYYLTWSCSWEKFYIIDSKDVIFSTYACDENGLTLMQIPPHQTSEKLLLLKSLKDRNQLHRRKFKIGFKLYKAKYSKIKNMNSYPDIYKYFTPKNEIVLWSHILELL